MFKLIAKVMGWGNHVPTLGDERYARAMQESDDLLEQLGKRGNEPARQIVSDVLKNRNNIPYVTTAYEAIQEMNAPLKQSRS